VVRDWSVAVKMQMVKIEEGEKVVKLEARRLFKKAPVGRFKKEKSQAKNKEIAKLSKKDGKTMAKALKACKPMEMNPGKPLTEDGEEEKCDSCDSRLQEFTMIKSVNEMGRSTLVKIKKCSNIFAVRLNFN
jgi:hypothetical protein